MPIVLGIWTGLALARGAAPAGAWWSVIVLALLVRLAWRSPPRTGALLLVLAALAAGYGRGAAGKLRLEAMRAALPADGTLTRMRLVIEEPVRRETGVPLAIGRVLVATPAVPRNARIRLRLPAECAAEWGDTVSVYAPLERFAGARNPGGFDSRRAADGDRVLARGHAYTARVNPARGVGRAPVALAMRLRRAMEAALLRELSLPARELVAPLLFGDRSAMTPETDARLRASGLVHLLALSGLHVAWLAAVARGLAALAGGGVAARALAGAGCALGYALLAGPLPSLMRAVAGEFVTAAARLSQRALDPVQGLALGAGSLLAFHPGWADDLGFQLSCAATLGLVTLSGPFAAPLARRRGLAAFAQPVTTTLAAQATALPIVLARFHALPWTGVVANLLAVPVAELLLASAWLGGLFEALLPGSGALVLHAGEPLAWALRTVTDRAASPPLALLPCGGDPAPAWLAAAGAALLALALPPPRTIAGRLRAPANVRAWVGGGGAFLCACSLLAALTARPLTPPAGSWWLVGVDVGQGDALALAFADEWWLVDCGPRSPTYDAGEGAVLPFLRWAGVRRLRRLIVTHDDGDHTGGAPAIRRGLLVSETDAPCARPEVPGPAWRFHAHELARGERLRASPGVRVLWPPRPGESGEGIARRGDNAAALVLEAGEGAARALLMADADSVVEAELAFVPGAALLKAGHHGSGSSSGAGFVARVRPRRVLLSVGLHNRYGHPDPGALARLAARGAVLDRTDADGALWYELGPAGVRRIDWRRERLAPGRRFGPCGVARAPRVQ